MENAVEFSYPGGELPLFAQARNWKFYIKSEVGEFLIGDVLEIGAGIGGTTTALNDGSARQWLCLEPDPNQAKHLQFLLARNSAPPAALIVGSLAALAPKPMFDCVLYIDVFYTSTTIVCKFRQRRGWCDREAILWWYLPHTNGFLVNLTKPLAIYGVTTRRVCVSLCRRNGKK
jgi:hypothetical protein